MPTSAAAARSTSTFADCGQSSGWSTPHGSRRFAVSVTCSMPRCNRVERSQRSRASRFRAPKLSSMAAEPALRANVRLLGNILGATLVEQEGAWLLELVEQVRARAGAGRSGDAAAAGELARLVAELPLEQQSLVLRSFALYFQL